MKHKRQYSDYKDSFEELFLIYFPKVKSYISKFIGSEAEAEDISQDIFIKLWSQKEIFDDIKSVDAYLYKMAKNSIYNYVKHQAVTRKYIEQYRQELTVGDGYDTIYSKEIETLINNTVSKMPPQRKKIFLMSRQEGLSNIEISEKLNISKRTVDSHLNLALSELKKISFLLFFLFSIR